MKKLTTLIFAMVLSLAAMAEQPFKAYCEVWGTTTTDTRRPFGIVQIVQPEGSYFM